MQVYVHVILTFIFAGILSPFLGFYSLVVFLSGFVFDIDHYFYYILKKRDFSLVNSYLYCVQGSKVYEPHTGVLHIFHTWEMWVLFFILGVVIHVIFLYALIGLIFHMLLDWGYLFFNQDSIDIRVWSLIGWISRN
ncbi:MAG: hypothetical protein CMH63_02800 [Nanoarchaeota archaeon]|jgi:hypothetical protein|nr:hypothetical protein [Nanoarchaeota archaeon]|tara:strand:- start:11344 stop:11751 length:408 start_codon:yes stop_codon:yes gene_type:complete